MKIEDVSRVMDRILNYPEKIQSILKRCCIEEPKDVPNRKDKEVYFFLSTTKLIDHVWVERGKNGYPVWSDQALYFFKSAREIVSTMNANRATSLLEELDDFSLIAIYLSKSTISVIKHFDMSGSALSSFKGEIEKDLVMLSRLDIGVSVREGRVYGDFKAFRNSLSDPFFLSHKDLPLTSVFKLVLIYLLEGGVCLFQSRDSTELLSDVEKAICSWLASGNWVFKFKVLDLHRGLGK